MANNIVAPVGGGSGSGSGEVVQASVLQVAHGLSVLDVVRIDGLGNYVIATANNPNTLGQFLVTEVVDANNFVVVQTGLATVTGHGLTPGEYYFLSDTIPGALTLTEPPTYSNPILFVRDANELWVYPWRPLTIGESSLSGGVNALITKSFQNAGLSTDQLAGFAANDPIQFDDILASNGADIAFNTVTYTFTLSPDRTYRLDGQCSPVFSASTGEIIFQWYDVTNAAFIGTASRIVAVTLAGDTGLVSTSHAVVSPSVTTEVQLRIVSSSDVSSIVASQSFCFLETINASITASTSSYIRRTNGSAVGSTNGLVVRFLTAEEVSGTDITYEPSVTLGDGFRINTSGIYACSGTFTSSANGTTTALMVGGAITNSLSGPNVRSEDKSDAANTASAVSWTGFIQSGDVVYMTQNGTAFIGAPELSQITIARIA